MRDEMLREAISELKQQALDELLAAEKWWWGDRKRRIAVERYREVQGFETRLRVALELGKQERIRAAA